jgi:hypothetical protein
VGAIAAPFMLMLGSQLRIGSPVFLPYLIFGAISCLAGLLVLLLPVSREQSRACWKTLFACLPECSALQYQSESSMHAKLLRV